jgi:hypothetical protein
VITDTRPWTHEGTKWQVQLENGVGTEKTPPGVGRPITIAGVWFRGTGARFMRLAYPELPESLTGVSDEQLAWWFARARKSPRVG